MTFKSCLRRKAEQDDFEIFLIKELVKHTLELMLLVGVMAIQSQDNWYGIVHALCPCKWDKDRLNLLYEIQFVKSVHPDADV